MGTTTLSTRRARLAAYGGIPRSQSLGSDISTELDGCIADALRYIYTYAPWEWLRAQERIRLKESLSGGTVSVSKEGTAWTGVGTAFEDLGGVMVMRAGSEEYRVSSVDSTTGITSLDVAIEDLSGEGYILFTERVTLSAVSRIEVARVGSATVRPLRIVSPLEIAGRKSAGFETGHPRMAAVVGFSGAYPILELFPVPGYDEVIRVVGQAPGTIPVDDGDKDDVPDEFTHVVDAACRWKYFEYLGDDRYMASAQEAEALIRAMLGRSEGGQGAASFGLDPNVFRPVNQED